MARPESRCLVIEDELPMRTQQMAILERSGVSVPTVGDADRARNRLLSLPLRVVSFDLRLPDASGQPSPVFGLELLEQRAPLAKRLVYTGFRNTDEGLAAIDLGGKGDFWVLSKAAQNIVERRTARATPLGWCALMLHLMGQPIPESWGGLRDEAAAFLRQLQAAKPDACEPWRRSYWRLAEHHLPQPLAQAAARYRTAITRSPDDASPLVGREGLLALSDFREWALWLACAQTAVILRQHAALQSGSARLSEPDAASDWLDGKLVALHGLPPPAPGAVAWRNHLGVYAQLQPPRGTSIHSSALQALETLRWRRNRGVHGLRPTDRPEDELTALPELMDLAAFWSSNPLLAEVRRERGQWRAKILAGRDLVDQALPDDLVVPGKGADKDHIYQLVWRFSGDGPADGDAWAQLGRPSPVLLDWWPYLRWSFNRELGVREPLLLTFAEGADQRRWHAQGFTGSLRKPELAEDEIRGLTKAPA